MTYQVPSEVLEAFLSAAPGPPFPDPETVNMAVIGNGLINFSCRIACENQPDLFLQRINKNVFPDPPAIQENYIRLREYALRNPTGFRMPDPVFLRPGISLFRDHNGDYWRGFEFIPNAVTIAVAATANQAGATAEVFARFTAAFEGFDMVRLQEVIPRFHDLGFRYDQFAASVQDGDRERLNTTASLCYELEKRKKYCQFYSFIRSTVGFPQRVMHHDAKIGNILFHEGTGRVICPVDYDTVMPGYFFSDLGDMIRSMAGTQDENSRETASIAIRPDFYEAIINRYTTVLGAILTQEEKNYIHSAGLLMIYMQALRFLTDYHKGDTYYQTGYPDQNLDRAMNQFALLKALEDFLTEQYTFSV